MTCTYLQVPLDPQHATAVLTSLDVLTQQVAWLLQVLTMQTSAISRKTKKRLLSQQGLELLLTWWYHVACRLYTSKPHGKVGVAGQVGGAGHVTSCAQMCDCFVSVMTGLELTLSCLISFHGPPQHFIATVSSALMTSDLW